MPQEDRPNILLIVMDTARADHLSCYGHPHPTTPVLDQLAEEGTRFATAISPAEWTVPSHASLFTGTFPSRHSAVNQHRYLDGRLHTLAEVLGRLGYRTACFTNNAFISEATGLNRGFRLTDGPFRWNGSRRPTHLFWRGMRKLTQWTGRKDQGAMFTNLLVYRWLLRRWDGEHPFFLFINYVEPHMPHRWIPEPFRRRFLQLNGLEGADWRSVNMNYRAFLTGTAPMGEEDFAILRALYEAEMAYLDHRIGQLVAFLRRRGILDNTLLIITSDHGDNLGEHGLMHHAYALYETLIHVPLIIRYPPAFPAGMVVEQIVQTHDLFPTILHLAGVDEPTVWDQVQGFSLLPDHLSAHPDYAVAELMRPINEFAERYPDFDFSPFDRELRAYRTRRYKYIWASDGRDELYDLVQDPGETDNLIHKRPDVAADLRQRLLAWMEAHPIEASTVTEVPEYDEAVLARLRDLGYVE